MNISGLMLEKARKALIWAKLSNIEFSTNNHMVSVNENKECVCCVNVLALDTNTEIMQL